MTHSEEFTSPIGLVIARYLSVKRELGRCADTTQRILTQLDRFLVSTRAADLTLETFAAWAASIEYLAAGTRRQRMRTVYRFCLFRRRDEPTCFLPDPSGFPPPQPRRRPSVPE